MRMSVSSRACDQRKELQELHFGHEHDLMPIRPDSPLDDDQPKMHDQDRRMRRQVANSNERRRMQSINAGFQSLRGLIPHGDGEKLSKAAILQQTVGYITALESEKTRLMAANQQLHQRLLRVHEGPEDLSPPLKRKKRDTESSDEGIAGMTIAADLAMEEHGALDMRKEMVALRKALDRERLQRLALEEQKSRLEEQVYPAKIRQAASEIQVERYQEERQRRLQQQQQEQEDLHRPPHRICADEKRLRTWSEPPSTSRNMEILLEAFRVIEGDRSLFEDKTKADSDDDILSSACESPLSRLSDSEVKQEPAAPVPLMAAPSLLGHPAAMAAAAMRFLPHPGLQGLVRPQQPPQQQES